MRYFVVLFGVLFTILIGCASNKPVNHLALIPFDPLTEAKEWEIWSFYVIDAVDTAGMPVILLPDTVQFSWNAPTYRRALEEQPLPTFHRHEETKTKVTVIPNSRNLYKYLYANNDTSIFVSGTISDLVTGVWEFSVVCVDTAGYKSQFSEPCVRYVKKIGLPPGQAVDVWIILK